MTKEFKARLWEIFVKKLPSEPINDKTRQNYESVYKQCVEIVELFEKETNESSKDSNN